MNYKDEDKGRAAPTGVPSTGVPIVWVNVGQSSEQHELKRESDFAEKPSAGKPPQRRGVRMNNVL